MTTVRVPVREKALTRVALLGLLVGIGLLAYRLGRREVPAPDALSGPAWPAGASPDWLLVVAGVLTLCSIALLAWGRSKVMRVKAHDPVGGQHMRRSTDAVMPALLDRDDRAGEGRLAVLLLDVDCLDEIQRRYGHEAVDAVLRLVGEQIRGQTRSGDLACRHGDRQVAVFLRGSGSEQAVAFARRIAMLLSSQQLEWGGDVIKVTASMGIVVREPDEASDALLLRAGEKLAAATEGGPNRILV